MGAETMSAESLRPLGHAGDMMLPAGPNERPLIIGHT